MRQQRAEQRRGLGQHTGRPGADAPLTVIEGDVMQADGKNPNTASNGKSLRRGQEIPFTIATRAMNTDAMRNRTNAN
nr:hypothetical protein GCM10020185_66710 [Pseudomonas brassicacearum subsp. brassicacearum]